MGDYVDGGADRAQAGARLPRRRARGRLSRGRQRRVGGFTYGDFGRISGSARRSTATARSGPRRCGTCAREVGAPTRAA